MRFFSTISPFVALAQLGAAHHDIFAGDLEGRQATQSSCTTISGATVVCTSVLSYTYTLPSASTVTASMTCTPTVSASSSTSSLTTLSTARTTSTTSSSSSSPSTTSRSSTTTSSSTTSRSSTTTSATPTPTSNKFVFAHYMVGVAQGYALSDWQDDIAKAKAAHIDAFALNIASGDSWTDTQLPLAFQAAQQAGFKLFFSFDYGGGWSSSQVISKLQAWVSNSAYFQYNKLPFVSTFEGPGNAGDWPTIRASVPCFFVPDWASVGYGSFGNYVGYVDGAFSWDSWPTGANNMNTDEDKGWIGALGSKPYMMGLSPWFYTNLPQYNKNWAWRGDSLFHDRWQEVYALQPQFVQIISWNDYGESHYIGPIRPSGIPSGSERYVTNNTHDAWRALLPNYIDVYKYGSASLPSDQVVFWYRNAPVAAGSTGGTVGNAPWQSSVAVTSVLQDLIQVNALISALPATVTVQIGSNTATTLTVSSTGMNHWAVPFNGQTGVVKVAVVRSGAAVASASGIPILSAPADGLANYNAWVGSS